MSDTTSSSSRIGRVGGLLMLALAIAYGIGGSQIEYAFASDPLGPRVVPVLLAITLSVLCLFYLKSPGTTEAFPQGRLLVKIIAVPLLLLASALLLEPAGFAASIFLLTFGVGWIFGAPLRLALIGGVGQAALWWFVFSYLLDVYLPAGRLFG
ncbi:MULTISPECIES: tripartite tricarboxylate transporter TctB family protein [unclassified Ensifer]|uniref:tripartite tricarboxylate transporter TctB family protein n=1 Tax=unclassified Ensifer TaxID=2633371 RepID=UPI000DE0A6AF|nr:MULTISPECIES: tripartite tricarboxylate transporter TctB family protein [unclassified Ensifer]MBD9497475.1 tripartite tricarboxylate transporter TctB family protein [Ensifer sp. ENS01]MBD9572931.1 tripartite tricarboxylate transporter TctB family protein [Ensifer sp. ENS08]